MSLLLSGFTHERSTKDEWYTPPWLFERLGLAFDLDPAMPLARLSWIPATHYLTVRDNGLAHPWQGRVWLNPPYGTATGAWLRRFLDHGDGCALVFARTDTGWFHETAARADALCFLRHRVKFVRQNGKDGASPGCGSMLLAMGTACVDAIERATLGTILEPR